MGDVAFNIAKGRSAELYNRVKLNDPANSAIVVVVLKAAGLEADATLIDYGDLATLLAAANDEATNTGYARKVLDDTVLASLTVDNTNNRMPVDLPDQTWTAVQATGGAWGAILICYDADTTGGTDSNIIPLTKHDFAVTPDGTDIVAAIADFLRAA